MHGRVPIAPVHGGAVAAGGNDIPGKGADVVVAAAAGAGHRAGGVALAHHAAGAGGNAHGAHQSAQVDVVVGAALHRRRGIAGYHLSIDVARQPAQRRLGPGGGHRAAAGVAVMHPAARFRRSHQNAGAALVGVAPRAAGHIGVHQPHIPHHRPALQFGEQPGIARVAVVHQHIVDFVAVAVKDRPIVAQRRKVGVGIRGGDRPAPIGVKIQILGQFVPHADPGGAAHPGAGAFDVRPDKPLAVSGIVAGGGQDAVAVQVVTDGVQLVQGGYVDQPVVILVVIHDAARRGVDRGPLVGGSEPPGVVGEMIPV